MSEPEYQKVLCGGCGGAWEIPAGDAGQGFTCPACGQAVVLPAPAPPPGRATPPAARKFPVSWLMVTAVVLLGALLAVGVYVLTQRGRAMKESGDAGQPSRPAAAATATSAVTVLPSESPVSAAPRHINGCIRVVLADGRIAALPAVEVVLLEAAEGQARYDECWAAVRSNSAWLVSVKAGYEAQAETNSAQLRSLEEKLDLVIRLTDLAEEGIQLARTNIQAMGLSEAHPARDPRGDIAQLQSLLARRDRNIALQEQIRTVMKGLAKQGEALATKIRMVAEEQRRWHSPRSFFARPWRNVAGRANTGPDGRFSMERPATGDCWVAAYSSGSEEADGREYGWLLPLVTDSDGNFELSNNNALYLP